MLSGISDDFESDIESHTYPLAPGQGDCNPSNEIDPETGLPKGCEKKVEYKALNYLNDNDNDDNSDKVKIPGSADVPLDPEPRIHGGLLGGVMRDIQLSLQRTGSDAWYYIRSCETTEDFLLGRCNENAGRDSVSDDGLQAGMCSELYG